LKAEQVAVIPGSAFGPGGEGFVRCCYAASMKDLDEALKRMKRFIDSRK
jgi:aminotransferase